MKNYIPSVLFSLAIVLAAYFVGNAYLKRAQVNDTIRVKGLGKKDFVSDLIVWEGTFTAQNMNLREAYKQLDVDKKIISDYLKSKGVKPEEIVFQSVRIDELTRSQYNDEGRYMGDVFLGYKLSQDVKIKSKEVEKIEKVSREISELLTRGVQFYSHPPRYYYTKLADLKLEMISRATEDARKRAEKIAEHSGGKLGKLKSAQMGIFQITGQYSDEDYSWGGTFNTKDKEKTASITMKLVYSIK